jgi:osmotically-inducible protein OsmY
MMHNRGIESARRRSAENHVVDGTVADRIRAALEKEPRINLPRFPIKVEFSGSDIVLTGALENVAAKKLALALAAAIAPAAGLVDRLTVKPTQTMSDPELRDHSIKVLLDEPALAHCLLHSRLPRQLQTHRNRIQKPSGTIVVEVRNSVITLTGEVPSLSHKRLAGVLAWWVPGCRNVINSLTEVPEQQDNDDELSDAVRLVLEKEPFLNATKTQVRSKNGVVTLDGLAPNESMRRIAERDAWFVLGVSDVVNRIKLKW